MNDHPKGYEPGDATPSSGSETDVAPLGRTPKPTHELTADEDVDVADWHRLAASAEFKDLLRAKVRFIVPATVFFIVYYFTLPILVGYAPRFMERKLIGPVNIAYLFALSQFFMAWIVAAIYMRKAGGFDRMVAVVLDSFRKKKGGE
jgi:uncharacterized membrane protein (DUF485 family)